MGQENAFIDNGFDITHHMDLRKVLVDHWIEYVVILNHLLHFDS
jgi:hypothetical protein